MEYWKITNHIDRGDIVAPWIAIVFEDQGLQDAWTGGDGVYVDLQEATWLDWSNTSRLPGGAFNEENLTVVTADNIIMRPSEEWDELCDFVMAECDDDLEGEDFSEMIAMMGVVPYFESWNWDRIDHINIYRGTPQIVRDPDICPDVRQDSLGREIFTIQYDF